MKLIDTQIEIPWTLIKKYGYRPEDILFLTLETTGLSRQRSHLYLLGAAFYGHEQWSYRQWFCERPSDEKKILEEFSQLIQQKKLIIHFNGKTFHIPYLTYRYQLYDLKSPFDTIVQLDIYQNLSPYKNVLGLEHMRQTDLELYGGYKRSYTASREELIEIYENYISTGDKAYMNALLLNNTENIKGLLKLIPFLTISDLFSGKLSSFVHSEITADGELELDIFFAEPAPFSFTWENSLFRMVFEKDHCILYIPVYKGTLKFFFPDYKNYFYLPVEDEVIHKSLGIYVDSDHREQAKAANCYKKTKGRFLPQITELFTPSFREDYKGKSYWFSLKEHPLTNPEEAGIYATHLLTHALSIH